MAQPPTTMPWGHRSLLLRDPSGGAAGAWLLDRAASQVAFHVKHFWGAITVHGFFTQLDW